MNREEIIKLAREADLQAEYDDYVLERLERFAALVAAAEREACAKAIENYPEWIGNKAKEEISNAIRARSKQ